MKIRPPTLEEFGKVSTFFREEFYANTIYAESIDWDQNTALQLGQTSLSQNLFFVAVDTSNTVVGGIMGLSTPFMFNANVKVAAEIFFYVAPEHRTGGLGIKLLNRLEYQCHMEGIKLLTMVALSSHSNELVGGLYRTIGLSAF